MSEDLKANLLSGAQWLRILYMAFFAVVCWLLVIILGVLVVAQILFSLLSGRDNENLRQLGGGLGLLFYQILQFLTYNSERKPFPFAPLPGMDNAGGARADEAGPSPEEAPEASRTKAASAQASDDGDDVFADISFTRDTGGGLSRHGGQETSSGQGPPEGAVESGPAEDEGQPGRDSPEPGEEREPPPDHRR